jgi:predicted thioesterase
VATVLEEVVALEVEATVLAEAALGVLAVVATEVLVAALEALAAIEVLEAVQDRLDLGQVAVEVAVEDNNIFRFSLIKK